MCAGFSPHDFWGLSPRLYYAHMRGARERLKMEAEDRIEAAWLAAVLARADKLPALPALLGNEPETRSIEETKSKLNALSEILPKISFEDYCARKRG